MSHRHITAARILVFLSIVGTTLASSSAAHAQTVTGNGYVLSGNAIPITSFTSGGGFNAIYAGSPITGLGTSGGGYTNVPGSSGGAGAAGSTPVTPVTPTTGGGGGGIVWGNGNATPSPTAAPATHTPRPTVTPTTFPSETPVPAEATPVPQPSSSGKPSAPSATAKPGQSGGQTTTGGEHASAPGETPVFATPSPEPVGTEGGLTGTGTLVSPEPTLPPVETVAPSPLPSEEVIGTTSPVSNSTLWRIILVLATITLIIKLIRKASIRRKPLLELILSLVMSILTVVCVIMDPSWYYITSVTFSIIALLVSAYDLDQPEEKGFRAVAKQRAAAVKKRPSSKK